MTRMMKLHGGVGQRLRLFLNGLSTQWSLFAAGFAAMMFLTGATPVQAAEYQWEEYSPTLAYDYRDEFGELEPPTKILPGVSGIEGIYADDWWCFVWGTNSYPLVTDKAWIPMIERFNTDFAYISDVMGWPRDKRAQEGYYSTCYLLGSGLSTDAMTWDDPGGWMGATGWDGQAWPCIIATHYPVVAFDPDYADGYQTGAMVHEGIHAILADMPGVKNSAWFHEGGNTWLQATMEAQRTGNFSGMGWLSRGSAIAPFMPIECYSGWLQDGSFAGPSAEGVFQGDGICSWRGLLGGVQYSEAFPHAIETILGAKSVAWVWRNAHYSGRVLQDMAQAPGGLGDEQMRRLIREYRGRQAFGDFKQWSYAYRMLLHGSWNAYIGPEYEPYWINCDPWYATCYAATTNNAGVLTPEARTLPGWSGANQIPLTVDPAATSASVSFSPIGDNMTCQLVYRDTDGQVHYSDPVSTGTCSLPLGDVLNDVVVAVVCNSDYIYVDDSTREAKYDYRLTMGTGITGQADLYTKWWDYNPATYTVSASAAANGTISPAGSVVVDNGSVQTFTFAPDPGFAVDDVILNGFAIGSMSSYTFNPVLGDYSLEVTFRDIVSPTAPAGLGATANNGSVSLDWADNTEDDMDVYAVYRSSDGGTSYVLLAPDVASSDFLDDAIVDGITYTYVVTAVDVEANASEFSGSASVVAVDTLAPAAPTGLSVAGAGDAAVISWDDNGEPDLGTYTLYRSTTSGSGFAVVASGLSDPSYVDTPLAEGTTYYYVVTATDNSFNESVVSAEASPVSQLLARWDFNDPSLGAANDAVVPDSDGHYVWRAAAIDKTGNGNHLTTWDYPAAGFSWTNNSVDGDFSIKAAGDFPAAFTWSDRSSPSGTDLELFSGQSFTVEAVATISGSGYTRTVVGRDAQNLATTDSALSALSLGVDAANHARFCYVDVNGNTVEVISEMVYPSSETEFHHLAAASDGRTVSLYVDGALAAQATGQSLGGLGIGATSTSGFHAGGWSVARGLYRADHVDRWFGSIDSVAITATALEPGAFLLSELESSDPAPAAPANVTATPADGAVALDWDDNAEADIASYSVFRSVTPGVGYVPIRLGLTNSVYTDPSADNGTTYYYVIKALDTNSSQSEYSEEVSVMPVDVTPPSAPTGLSAVVDGEAVTLQWDDSSESDFRGYTVYRSTQSDSGYVAIASDLTVSAYVDNFTQSGTTYFYTVSASDSSQLESAASAAVSVTPILADAASGASIGSAGSWGNTGNTADKAFDGDLGTFYDAVNASGDWTGIDLGSAQTIAQIAYCPRSGFAGRMVNGLFQGSDTADFSSGVVTLFTVTDTPAEGQLTEQTLSEWGAYRYVRYIGPDGGYCDVAEVEFRTPAAADTTAPSAPAGVAATPGDSFITLRWDENSEPDVQSYTVYRSMQSGSGYEVIASGLSSGGLVDTTVENGSAYFYTVTAKDAALNESLFSAEVSATPSLDISFQIINGDFETGGNIENSADVTGWFDDNDGGFWDGAWQSAADWITAPPNDLVVFSDNDSAGRPTVDLNAGCYLYQSIGNAPEGGMLELSFDWGAPGDDPGGRELGMTVGIYAYDGQGGFDAADGVDVLNASGVTLLDSQSFTMLTTGGVQISNAVASLDLSGASNQEIFLRFNSFNAGTSAAWPVLDNVVLIESAPSAVTVNIAAATLVDASNLSLLVTNSVSGYLYRVQATDSLMEPAWTNVLVQTGSGSDLQFNVPVSAGSTNRFFRLQVEQE